MAGTYYTITVSPSYKMIDPERLHAIYERLITKEINKFSNHWILYPEFDNKLRLHYHGLVVVNDKIKMYKTKHKLDKIGHTKIDKPKDFKNRLTYLIYCQKQYAEIKSVYKPIMYQRMRRKKIIPEVLPSKKTILHWFQAKHPPSP